MIIKNTLAILGLRPNISFKFSLDMQIQNDGTPNELLKLITGMAWEGSFLLHCGVVYIIWVKSLS